MNSLRLAHLDNVKAAWPAARIAKPALRRTLFALKHTLLRTRGEAPAGGFNPTPRSLRFMVSADQSGLKNWGEARPAAETW